MPLWTCSSCLELFGVPNKGERSRLVTLASLAVHQDTHRNTGTTHKCSLVMYGPSQTDGRSPRIHPITPDCMMLVCSLRQMVYTENTYAQCVWAMADHVYQHTDTVALLTCCGGQTSLPTTVTILNWTWFRARMERTTTALMFP